MHQRLVIVRQGRRSETAQVEPLRHGADGNLQTLAYAEAMVRESAANEALRRKAVEITAACAPHDELCEIESLFEFVRDGIRFVDDPPGVERIADAETTLAEGAGDCGDKAILLRSLALTLGHRSRFVVQDWDGVVDDAGYDHVHPEFILAHGGLVQADPTERSGIFREEAPSRGRAVFVPFDDVSRAGMQYQIPDSRFQMPAGMGGFLDDFGGQLIGTGFQIGSQFAAGHAQQSQASAQQTKATGAQFDNLVSQATQVLRAVDAKGASLTNDDYNAALAYVQQVESFVQQYPIEYVTTQWSSDAYSGQAQRYLAKFAAALQGSASGQLPVAGGQSLTPAQNSVLGLSSSGNSVWLLVGVVAVVGILALRN